MKKFRLIKEVQRSGEIMFIIQKRKFFLFMPYWSRKGYSWEHGDFVEYGIYWELKPAMKRLTELNNNYEKPKITKTVIA